MSTIPSSTAARSAFSIALPRPTGAFKTIEGRSIVRSPFKPGSPRPSCEMTPSVTPIAMMGPGSPFRKEPVPVGATGPGGRSSAAAGGASASTVGASAGAGGASSSTGGSTGRSESTPVRMSAELMTEAGIFRVPAKAKEIWGDRVQRWFLKPAEALADPSYGRLSVAERVEAVANHTFPRLLDNVKLLPGYMKTGTYTDGRNKFPLEVMIGKYNGREGMFEWGRDPEGTRSVVHRYFAPFLDPEERAAWKVVPFYPHPDEVDDHSFQIDGCYKRYSYQGTLEITDTTTGKIVAFIYRFNG